MDPEIKEKMPFALKLKAWWEGYDQEELAARFAELAKEEGADDSIAPGAPGAPGAVKAQKKPQAAGKPEGSGAPDIELPFVPWDSKRIDIAQYIWGEGFCGPGGPDHVISMSKLLALSPEMSMCVLGAGLGGPSRTLADTFGAWVTGYEESEALVEAGNEISKRMGMAKKADIIHYTPSEFEEFDRKFDRALAKETLFYVKDKGKLLSTTFESIKPDGLILITDYILASETASMSDGYREWKDIEQGMIYPVTEEELKDLLETAGFSVRVHEDITDQEVALISDAWGGAEKVAAKLIDEEDGMALIDTLLKEAEFWAKRTELLKNGTLKVWRTLGYKKDSNKSMMSDW